MGHQEPIPILNRIGHKYQLYGWTAIIVEAYAGAKIGFTWVVKAINMIQMEA